MSEELQTGYLTKAACRRMGIKPRGEYTQIQFDHLTPFRHANNVFLDGAYVGAIVSIRVLRDGQYVNPQHI